MSDLAAYCRASMHQQYTNLHPHFSFINELLRLSELLISFFIKVWHVCSKKNKFDIYIHIYAQIIIMWTHSSNHSSPRPRKKRLPLLQGFLGSIFLFVFVNTLLALGKFLQSYNHHHNAILEHLYHPRSFPPVHCSQSLLLPSAPGNHWSAFCLYGSAFSRSFM